MTRGHDTVSFPKGPLPPSYYTENRSHVLLAVGISFVILEVTAFGLRVFARSLKRVPFGWDDAFMVPALIMNLGVCIMALVGIPYAGVGRHTLAVAIEDVRKLTFLGKDALLVVPIMYILAVFLSKNAILNLFLRIFTVGIARQLTYVICVIIVLQTIAFVFATIFQCNPISLLWTTTVRGHCIDSQAMFMYASIPNVVTDVAMLIMPLPTIWRLKAATHVKVGVTLTLMTASLGLITSILRMAGFIKADTFSDPAWYACDLFSYSIAEPGTYFLAACFPTYRPLGAYVKSSSLFSKYNSRYYFGSKRLGSSSGGPDMSAGIGDKNQNSGAPSRHKTARGFDSIALSAIENESSDRMPIV